MPAHEPCAVEPLAEVFERYQEEITGEWRLQAGKLLRELHLDNTTLTDHLPKLVAEIILDLALGCDETLDIEHTRDRPPDHGIKHFRSALDVGEVIEEYHLLRCAFNTVAERQP